MSCFLYLAIEFVANIFPSGISVWFNDHRSPNDPIIDKFSLLYNIRIALSKIFFHRCHFFNVLFIFTHIKHLLFLYHINKLFYVHRDKNIPHPQRDRGSGGTTLVCTVYRLYVNERPLSRITVTYRAYLLALSLLQHVLLGRFQCVSLQTFRTPSALLRTV